MKDFNTIEEALAAQDMRVATFAESGWYVTVLVQGEAISVWATDD